MASGQPLYDGSGAQPQNSPVTFQPSAPPESTPMSGPQQMVMSPTSSNSNTNDSLNMLLTFPSLLVKQKPRGWCLELCCGCESENEYAIYDPHSGGKKVLLSREHSSCLARNFCGSARPYSMTIGGMDGQEILKMERPYRGRKGGVFCCCCNFCFQVVRVYSGSGTADPGKKLGYVREEYSFFQPELSIYDENDNKVYKLIGGCCSCCGYYGIKIYDRHGETSSSQEHVGVIQKQWSGLAKELFTDADNFFITFPPNATAGERSVLLAALFLVDFLFFESHRGKGGIK